MEINKLNEILNKKMRTIDVINVFKAPLNKFHSNILNEENIILPNKYENKKTTANVNNNVIIDFI